MCVSNFLRRRCQRWPVNLAASVLALASLGSDAMWAGDTDWTDCIGSDVRKVIIGCTNVIEAGLDEGRPLDKAFVRRGSAFGKLGKLDAAIADFTKAITLNPNLVEAYAFRATAYKSFDKLTEAIADLDMAISLSGKETKLFNERGTVYRKAGQLDKAITDFSAAIKLDEMNLLAYMNRSGVFRQQREFKKALDDCRAADAIVADPANATELEASVAASMCIKQLKSFDKQEKTKPPSQNKPAVRKNDT